MARALRAWAINRGGKNSVCKRYVIIRLRGRMPSDVGGLPLIMARIERKYCLISSSYLAGLFDIFILVHIWQNSVCFGDFLPMRTLCDAWHTAPVKRSQHANATCRNIVGRNMLRAFGHRVATCRVLLAQIWPFSNLSQQHPTCRNTSQHGGQTHATSCAQQCCDRLAGA